MVGKIANPPSCCALWRVNKMAVFGVYQEPLSYYYGSQSRITFDLNLSNKVIALYVSPIHIDHIFTRRSFNEGGITLATFLPAEVLTKAGSH